jgi:hypothetical protein
MTHARRGSGFTLIEVLLATFVIALGVLGILALFAGAAKQQQASSFETQGVFAARNAVGLLTSNFSALGRDPAGSLPREDVWTMLPMHPRHLYLTAPDGLYFLVSVTQPATLYEYQIPPAGSPLQVPDQQQAYRFGPVNDPLPMPLINVGDEIDFSPGASTLEFKDRRLDPDSIRIEVTFSRVVDTDGDGQPDGREDLPPVLFSRAAGFDYASDQVARGTGIWTIPLGGDPCHDPEIYSGLSTCLYDPQQDLSYIQVNVEPRENGVDPARIVAFHFKDSRLGRLESVRIEKIEAVEYKWQTGQVVSLEDRMTMRLDASQPSGERPDQTYSVLYRRTATGAQAAVVTYQLTATASKTEYEPPELPADIALGVSPLRVGLMNLFYDRELDQYYFRVADETMLWAIQPGQVLFVQGNESGPPAPGSDGPVKVVRQIRETGLQGTPLWRGYLDKQPRAHGQGLLTWPDALAGRSVQLRMIGVRESVTSRKDSSVWKLAPLRAQVFAVPYQ